MNAATENGIALLIASGAIGLFVAVQLWTGVSYGINPPVRFQRKMDPFGYWLGITIPAAVAVVLGV